jgi:hypothetical protein
MPEAIRIPLRRRDGSIHAHALIDDCDREQADYRWYRLATGYVVRMIQRKRLKRMFYR